LIKVDNFFIIKAGSKRQQPDYPCHQKFVPRLITNQRSISITTSVASKQRKKGRGSHLESSIKAGSKRQQPDYPRHQKFVPRLITNQRSISITASVASKQRKKGRGSPLESSITSI
jgi:hypothetical protein